MCKKVNLIVNDFVLYENFTFNSTGRDVIAQAQSGTGKTATFSIAILQQIELEYTKPQALVLAPTRELAQQVNSSIHSFKKNALMVL